MDPLAAFFLVLLGLGAGALIGCVGIGGVIVVPALVYVLDVPPHGAVASAMLAFLMSGTVGTFVYARHRSIRWEMASWMWAGALPAAFGGALVAAAAAPQVLEAAVGLLSSVSGLHALLGRKRPPGAAKPPSNPVLLSVGAITGFSSAMTGTGGPLVLIPMLVWLDVAALAAIGLAQAIQLPIAVFATLGNIIAETVDLVIGPLLGIGIVIGTWIGAKLAHALPQAALNRAVSMLLVAVGIAILCKLAVAL